MSETKVYITTKEECQKIIDQNSDFVCSSCGKNLSPIETVDNRDRPTYWSGCEPCEHFDNGVRREVFLVAKEMVEKYHHVHYGHITYRDGNNEEREYWLKSQIRGTANFIARIFYVQKEIRQRAMEKLLTPSQKGDVLNTMNNLDPNNAQASEQEAAGQAAQADVANEQGQVNAAESAAQDAAVDAEVGE